MVQNTKLMYYMYYYIIIFVGELVTFKDIRGNSVCFHGGKVTLRALLHDIGFNFRKYDNR
jgi:hypothetical protein